VTASTPDTPDKVSPSVSAGVKIATPDLILFDDSSVPTEVMTDLIFENIGGQELISISRNDMVNGQDVIYQPIKNLTSLYLQYNPQNVLALQNTSAAYFKNFPIKFENKIPNIGTGPNGEIVYIDPNTGDIVINVINLEKDELVEVQILNSGSILSGTIYEVNN
jgi:hypothetical protein